MLETLLFNVVMMVAGSLSACALVLASLVSVALGGTGSLISKQRRLPNDSEPALLIRLAIGGALIGAAFAFIAAGEWGFVFPIGIASFAAGSIFAHRWVVKLNDAYLARAEANLASGDYQGAIEDAKEVARSSEELRKRANVVIEMAREFRLQDPFPYEPAPAPDQAFYASAARF